LGQNTRRQEEAWKTVYHLEEQMSERFGRLSFDIHLQMCIKTVRISLALLTLLTLITSVPAYAQPRHCKFIDVGMFGGTASYFSNGLDGILNNGGTAVGWADKSIADEFPMF
jgi:hypothetical protein